jgi:outer membrane protein assembly factor BamA
MKTGLFLAFGLWAFLLPAQESGRLIIVENGNAKALKKLKYQENFRNAPEKEKILNGIFRYLFEKGYLAAGIDSTQSADREFRVYINPGKTYTWGQIRIPATEERHFKNAGAGIEKISGREISPRRLSRFASQIIGYYENHGYPFVSLRLDSLKISERKVEGTWKLEKGPLVKIDSIIIKGDGRINPAFIYAHTGIRPGDLYEEQKVNRLPARIKEIPFLKPAKDPEIVFTKDYTKLNLVFSRRKASRFDGILGMLPDSRTGKVIFTGDVKLKLLNSFNRGETIELNWRQLRPQTQDLTTRINYPFIFKSNFGISAGFKLYKRDTTFLESNPSFGLEYFLGKGRYFKGFWEQKQSSVLSNTGFSSLGYLPPIGDVKTNLYGLSFRMENLDYAFNPRKGFTLQATARAGQKTIFKTGGVNEQLYQGVDLETSFFSGEAEGAVYFPLAKRAALKYGLRGGGIIAENIFKNELLRLGGFLSLRGFDEESILATAYGIQTLELRYLFEENAYAYVFSDQAYYENYSLSFGVNDLPYSFGAGISFETKGGIFSLAYALGHQFSNPILLRNGKVHFGLVSLF